MKMCVKCVKYLQLKYTTMLNFSPYKCNAIQYFCWKPWCF